MIFLYCAKNTIPIVGEPKATFSKGDLIMDETKILLQDEIVGVLNTMKELSPDSEKYEKTLDGLVKLYGLKLEEKKLEQDFKEKEARREMEDRHHTDEVDASYSSRKEDLIQKVKQHRFQILELIISTGITAATFGASFFARNFWMKKTFLYEEHGTITGNASRETWRSMFKPFNN